MNWNHIIQFQGYDVNNVSLKEESSVVRIQLVKKVGSLVLCYKCGSELDKGHSFQRMQVEDLPILDKKTYLSFRRIKARCPQCKKIRLESVSFLAKSNPKMTSRLSFLLYKLCEIAPVSKTAEVLEMSSSSLWRNDLKVLQNQFENYEIPDVRLLSVDEVYARANHGESETYSDRFFTVITCLDRHKVVWVGDSKRREALDEFFKILGKERCAKIEAIATDEHSDYVNSVKEHCLNAIHILDRFHLTAHLEKAVNETRKLLFKMLPQEKVRKLACSRFRFIFGKKASRRTPQEAEHIEKVKKDNEAFINLELAKERLLTFFDAENEEEALAIFLEAEEWINESGLVPMKKFCKKIRGKWEQISNYFMCRLTTAVSEGLNNVIKATKRRAFGFRNMEYFKLKILQIAGLMSSKYMDLNGQLTNAGQELLMRRSNH